MSSESLTLAWYPEARFGGYSHVDGTMVFYTRVNALLKPSSVVLDIGCGRGAYGSDEVEYRRNLRIFRGKCRRVIGIDVDAAGRENPYLDEFRLIAGDRWPVEDEAIDLAICDYVLEHIPQPDQFFAECRRVLKPGGVLCVRTPSKYGYVALISRLTPNQWHAPILKRVHGDHNAADVFPTVYRCNTARTIGRLMRRHGLTGCVYHHEVSPTYLVFSKYVYALGVVLHRLMPAPFKSQLFAFGRKAA